ncbi:MAG: DNA-protecting protein DprA [Bacilli bacterium]|nr:DNA-protecting protein DprA [Bacilli bacterium]
MNLKRASELLASISILEGGDWYRIYERIQSHDIPEEELIDKTLKELKCHYITILDKEYPVELKRTVRPPFVLFYYGDISLALTNRDKLLAVIGSRECSEYGEMATRKIVSEVAKDLTIVSGLAKGIDAIAAETAINSGGRTIAIIGSGIDYCYPYENLELYRKIKKDHLLISEYPGRTPPNQGNFPFRNRLIAFFCKNILVTEAGDLSGTSITVNWGLSMGRDIMCVPYPLDRQSACNRMIKEGALLVENGEDVNYYMQ